MKYTKQETTYIHHMMVDFEPEDYILVKMGNHKIFALKYNEATRTMQFILSGVGDRLDKAPFFEIRQDQIEDLDVDPKKGQYVNVVFSSKYYDEVKERLKGLPIIV